MKQPMDDVREFHEKFGVLINDDVKHFGHVPPHTRKLRVDLLIEECTEYLQAECDHDIVQIADALADMVYIICGTALSYGIPLHMVWDTIHASNMRKIGGPTREDGKILKPEGWNPPDVKGVLGL